MRTRDLIVILVAFFIQHGPGALAETTNAAAPSEIHFIIAITNDVMALSNTGSVLHCRIENTTTNRLYFYPWDPEKSTQVFALSNSGAIFRITEDDINNYRGGPSFILKPKSTKDYIFRPPRALESLDGYSELYCEMLVYFDQTIPDIDKRGQIMYKLRSNVIRLGIK